MSKLAKNWPFPGNIQSSRKFLEDPRNNEILKFSVGYQVSWHKLSGIHTLHVEISQTSQYQGIPGILEPYKLENFMDLTIEFRNCTHAFLLIFPFIERSFKTFNMWSKD